MAAISHELRASSWNGLSKSTFWICRSCRATAHTSSHTSKPTLKIQPHQRRLSSSRTSRSSRSDARAIAATQGTAARKTPRASEALRSKINRSYSKSTGLHKCTADLPTVPSTKYLHPTDVHVASFFAVGRPISVTSSIPPLSTATTFSNIFAPSYQPNINSYDVIDTLSSAVSRLDIQSSGELRKEVPEEVDLHTALTQSTKATKLREEMALESSPPRQAGLNFDDLKQQFRPFNAPPPPQPLGILDVGRSNHQRQPQRRHAIHKAYSMTVNILESTYRDGQTLYTASASDLHEKPDLPATAIEVSSLIKQPFLGRMQERQRRTWNLRDQGPRREIWRSISVKRQRKLKMKKHKYKKLMRKTRTLRRKLERG